MGDNSRITWRCCGSTCPFEDDPTAQPCWGRVAILEDGVHGCEGHSNLAVGIEGYEPDPDAPEEEDDGR